MLKAIMLRKKLDETKAKLEKAREKMKQLETREAELEQAIEEATTDEEKAAVEEEVTKFEAEKTETEADVKNLEAEVDETEKELKELEDKQRTASIPATVEKRGDFSIMETRKFFKMTSHERDAFIAREDVKDFLQRVRNLAREQRTVSGAELTIPTVILNLLREQIENYSKLYAEVNVQDVSGMARQTVMGTIPEAVWTEMCATLNELSIGFANEEVDGYKVGGYIPVCNAILADSDIALAETIITALGKAIGLALDKAIIYGTGIKMPTGIVTRLAQTAAPSGYPAKARPWVDLHTSNILKIANTEKGIELFKAIITDSVVAKGKYSAAQKKIWIMNEATKIKLVCEALSINAAGAIVTGINDVMPVAGGKIITLDFIPDNNIITGYGDLYLLAERQGTTIAQSEHVKFIEDQTVFKGIARYDGKPVIAEGFVVITLAGTTATTSISFAPDTANTP